MIPLVLLLMADRYTGNAAHEWGGVLWLCLLLCHVWTHRGWYRAVCRGRVFLAHPVRALINIALVGVVCGVAASAVPISNTLLAGMGGDGGLGARSVHVCCAHWCFLLAAAHLGLYWKRLAASMRKLPFAVGKTGRVLFRVASPLLAAYGAWAFLEREWVFPLTMSASFAAWRADDGPILLILDTLAIFYLWAWGAYCAAALTARRGNVS